MATLSNSSESAPYILRLPRVCEVTGLGRSMIYQLEADGRFPRRIKLTSRTVGWLEAEVHDWLTHRIACSRSQELVRAAGGRASLRA